MNKDSFCIFWSHFIYFVNLLFISSGKKSLILNESWIKVLNTCVWKSKKIMADLIKFELKCPE